MYVRSFLPLVYKGKSTGDVPTHIKEPQVQLHWYQTPALDGGKQNVSQPNYFTDGQGTSVHAE
jgi:hypothetical protein